MRRGLVIDKVEIRVPSRVQFTSDFGKLYRDHSRDSRVFRPSPHYIRSGDLRAFDYSAILHVHCVHGKEGDHKLELIDTGELSFQEMQRLILRIFEVEPSGLALMRIDLAADVAGIPVCWFARNARVKWKQWTSEIGRMEYAEMGRRKIETLYYGKRPNCIRIYDKISELHHQYDQMLRKASDAAELPTFEEKFHYPDRKFVLTRVERQIAGGRVPAHLDRISKLRRLPDFNPFQNLELLALHRHESNHDDYPLSDVLAGRGLAAFVDEMGIHRTRAFLNLRSRGNAARIMRRYTDFIHREPGIDSSQLLQRYRDSVTRQLAA